MGFFIGSIITRSHSRPAGRQFRAPGIQKGRSSNNVTDFRRQREPARRDVPLYVFVLSGRGRAIVHALIGEINKDRRASQRGAPWKREVEFHGGAF